MNGPESVLQTQPGISVVIPVYNGEATIGRCLDSILDQDLPREEYEIVVVDNGSTDRTPEILAGYDVRRVPAMPRGRPVARNHGLAAARAPLIAFIDADCWATPSWLRELRNCLIEGGYDLVGGETTPARPVEEQNLYELQEVFKFFTREKFIKVHHAVTTCSALFRREVYETIGGFDEVLVNSEDFEWGRRAWSAGFRLGYAGKSFIYTETRDTFRSFWEKQYRTGYGCAQVGVRHHEEGQITFTNPWRYRPPLSLLRSKFAQRFPHLRLSDRVGFFFLYWFGYFIHEYGNLRGWIETPRLAPGELARGARPPEKPQRT